MIPDPNDVSELIARRRTIKPAEYTNKPVDESLIEQILTAANWAPTHGHTEPWRFHVFVDAARKRLGQFLSSTYREITDDEHYKEAKFEKLLQNPQLAPCVIAVCMKRQDIEKILEIEEVEAVACAVQNMHLMATAVGLAAFWSSNPVVYTDNMNRFLGLGERDKCLGLFYLGHAAVNWPDGKRSPIADKVRWIRL